MKALTRTFVAVLVMLAACSTGGTTGTNASLPAVSDLAELETLQTELAQFASEVETAAPASIQAAWSDLETAMSGLISSGSDLDLTETDLAPLQEAADAVTEAVETDGADLSDEFREFWSNFTTRIQGLAS